MPLLQTRAVSTLGTMTDLHSRVLALLKTSAGNLLMLMTQGHCSSSYEDTFGNNLECHKKVELNAFFFLMQEYPDVAPLQQCL